MKKMFSIMLVLALTLTASVCYSNSIPDGEIKVEQSDFKVEMTKVVASEVDVVNYSFTNIGSENELNYCYIAKPKSTKIGVIVGTLKLLSFNNNLKDLNFTYNDTGNRELFYNNINSYSFISTNLKEDINRNLKLFNITKFSRYTNKYTGTYTGTDPGTIRA